MLMAGEQCSGSVVHAALATKGAGTGAGAANAEAFSLLLVLVRICCVCLAIAEYHTILVEASIGTASILASTQAPRALLHGLIQSLLWILNLLLLMVSLTVVSCFIGARRAT